MSVQKKKFNLELPGSEKLEHEQGSRETLTELEINDIYDSMYGNVQSKLEYYESRNSSRSNSKSNSPTIIVTMDFPNENIPDLTAPKSPLRRSFSRPTTPIRKRSESTSTFDLLKDCNQQCSKCEKSKLAKDRTEILTEINTNLKLQLENSKKELKKEIEKNNLLNFEIANIEQALETYYEEAKYQKSTISTLYTSLKSFSKYDGSYTYKRIKAISDYIEILKMKLQEQDKIIRDNFADNPYTTDMVLKYEALMQQIDVLSLENQELKNDLRRKGEEEVEIIKELNRQKFKVEEKCRGLEVSCKKEIAGKEATISELMEEQKRKDKQIEEIVEQRAEEMLTVKKMYEARIDNYKDEIAIVYRRWKNGVNEI